MLTYRKVLRSQNSSLYNFSQYYHLVADFLKPDAGINQGPHLLIAKTDEVPLGVRGEEDLHYEGVHHLPPHLREGQVGAVFLPPVVGGDEDLHEGVEEPDSAVEILSISPSGSRLSEMENQSTNLELQLLTIKTIRTACAPAMSLWVGFCL